MSRLSKNSIAAGLTTLLVTTALSFSANGATTTTSYAEAQFIAGAGPSGQAVNVLGDGLEDGGSNACEPATDDCPDEAFTESPLQALNQLTIPAGDQLAGSEIGPAGNYAKAGNGASRAASGAVTSNGLINVGGGSGTAEADATIKLSDGILGDTGLSDALADVTAEIGAVSSTTKLDSPTADPVRDYNIAGANVVLTVPALTALDDAVDTEGDVDLEDVTLSSDTLCDALGGSLNVVADGLGLGTVIETVLETAGLITDGQIDLCDNDVAEALGDANLIEAKITGLSAVTDGLATFTNDKGVVFDFAEGTITLDIAEVLKKSGTDINNLPENTDLIAEVAPALALNIDDLLADLNDDIIENVKDNFDVELTLGGTDVPLDALNDGVRDELLPAIQDGLTQLEDLFSDQIGEPLADGLTQITDGLAQVIQLVVNVPDRYIPLQSGGAEAQTLVASEQFSETALNIRLLDGQLADLLLANTLVGPNTAVDAADDDGGNAATAGDGDDNNADSNADSNADGAAAATGGNGNNDSIADADSAADSDAAATLPSTGAPNLLPFFLLGLALLAFGLAVLLNERRRLGSAGPDELA